MNKDEGFERLQWIEVEYPDRVFKFYLGEWLEFRAVYVQEWRTGKCLINSVSHYQWKAEFNG